MVIDTFVVIGTVMVINTIVVIVTVMVKDKVIVAVTVMVMLLWFYLLTFLSFVCLIFISAKLYIFFQKMY